MQPATLQTRANSLEAVLRGASQCIAAQRRESDKARRGYQVVVPIESKKEEEALRLPLATCHLKVETRRIENSLN